MAPKKNSLSIRLTESAVFLRTDDTPASRSSRNRANAGSSTRDGMLRGLLVLDLVKPTKITSVDVELSAMTMTTWPEGIGARRVEISEEHRVFHASTTYFRAAHPNDTSSPSSHHPSSSQPSSVSGAHRRTASIGPGVLYTPLHTTHHDLDAESIATRGTGTGTGSSSEALGLSAAEDGAGSVDDLPTGAGSGGTAGEGGAESRRRSGQHHGAHPHPHPRRHPHRPPPPDHSLSSRRVSIDGSQLLNTRAPRSASSLPGMAMGGTGTGGTAIYESYPGELAPIPPYSPLPPEDEQFRYAGLARAGGGRSSSTPPLSLSPPAMPRRTSYNTNPETIHEGVVPPSPSLGSSAAAPGTGSGYGFAFGYGSGGAAGSSSSSSSRSESTPPPPLSLRTGPPAPVLPRRASRHSFSSAGSPLSVLSGSTGGFAAPSTSASSGHQAPNGQEERDERGRAQHSKRFSFSAVSNIFLDAVRSSSPRRSFFHHHAHGSSPSSSAHDVNNAHNAGNHDNERPARGSMDASSRRSGDGRRSTTPIGRHAHGSRTRERSRGPLLAAVDWATGVNVDESALEIEEEEEEEGDEEDEEEYGLDVEEGGGRARSGSLSMSGEGYRGRGMEIQRGSEESLRYNERDTLKAGVVVKEKERGRSGGVFGMILGDKEREKEGWREFKKGTYTYPISFRIPFNAPPSMTCDFGSVTWRLKANVHRPGAFKARMSAAREVVIISCPTEEDTEDTENIIVERHWEQQLQYLISVSGRSFYIGGTVPVTFTLMPLNKVKIHRISVFIEEKVDYFTHMRRLTRSDPPGRFVLLSLRNEGSKASEPILPLDSTDVDVLRSSPLFQIVENPEGADLGEVASNLMGPGPWTFHRDLKLPASCEVMKFTNRNKRANVNVTHMLKLVMRVERGDDEALDKNGKRKLFDIVVQTPVLILSCRCNPEFSSLPRYTEILNDAADITPTCPCRSRPRHRRRQSDAPTTDPTTLSRIASRQSSDDSLASAAETAPVHPGSTRSLRHSAYTESVLRSNTLFERLVSGQESETGEAPPAYDVGPSQGGPRVNAIAVI